MKNRKLLVVFIALVMICSIVMAGYAPLNESIKASSAANTSAVTNEGVKSDSFSKLDGDYTRKFDPNVFAEGMLTTSDELDALTNTERFDADEEIWVIVEMHGDSLVAQYNNTEKQNYSSLEEYVNSRQGALTQTNLLVQQSTLMKSFSKAKLNIEYKYNYTSILNGFAAKIRFGDISKLKAYSAVKNVIVSEVYDIPQAVVSNEVSVYSTGIFDSSACGYTGEGLVVAVLDTGIDYEHEVFKQDMDDLDIAMDKEYIASKMSGDELKAKELYAGLTVDDVYFSKKIPFAFDYADKDTNAYPINNPHGVHVSGIIVGQSDTITGVAPDAQLCAMKVFSDFQGGARQVDILAALADCITLGVDVINMSLGSDGGYQTVAEGNYMGTLYDSLRTAGISMLVAAGNTYNSYMNSAYGSTALTSNPDTGIISSPASFVTTTAVASISGVKSEFLSANDGETIAFFDDASNAASIQYDFYNMLEAKLKKNPSLPQFENGKVKLEYVTVPGLGSIFNYRGIDVQNKIALVQRGTITFEEKAMAANTSGALAVIIYNNTTGVIRMSIGNDLQIPACSINMDSGNAIAAHPTGTITLDRNNLAGPFISDFSSWGPLPDLTLDPDITGHGGNILSSITGGNKYALYSGTSMATPNLAGVTLLIREYLQKTYPHLTRQEITPIANQLLMSTATIANNEDGDPYSPRKQGAGLANLTAALNTKAYLTVDGSEFTKLSLYDDKERTGVYDLNFNLVNIGTENLSYAVDTDVMAEQFSWVEDYEVFSIKERAHMFNDSNIRVEVENGTYNNGKITVEGGKTAKISISITISADAKAHLANFENGTYVEGFARLIAQEEGSFNLNIPYLAFYGDWTDAPMFDEDYYDVEASKNDGTLTEEEKLKATIYPTTPMSAYYLDIRPYSSSYLKNTYVLPMGLYLFNMPDSETPINPDRDKNAVGYYVDTTYGLYNVYLGLLRGAKWLDFTISEYYTGKIVTQKTYNNLRKAFGGMPSFIYDGQNAEESSELVLDNMLFYTQALQAANNTKYLVTIDAGIDYEGGDKVPNHSYSFEFYVDYEAPTLTNVEYRIKENVDNYEKPYSYYANLSIYDNHYTMAAFVGHIFNDGNRDILTTVGNAYPIRDARRNSVSTIEIDITDYMQYVDENDCLTIIVQDYAMNESYYIISLPRNITNLRLKEADQNITLKTFETRTVTPIVTPSDQWADGLNWVSSDTSVAVVNNGVIYAVGEGNCTITITDKPLFVDKENTDKPWFTNGTHWEGSAVINVTVDAESGTNRKANPTKFNFDGFTFKTGFYRDSLGMNWNPNLQRTFGGLDIYPNEELLINYSLEPWNIIPDDYRLEWRSGNPSIATVEEFIEKKKNSQGIEEEVLSGYYIATHAEGTTRITVKVVDKATGKDYTSASLSFEVSDPFVIQNYQLVKYYGFGDENGVVTLPTDAFYNSIGDYAFIHLDDTKLNVRPDSHAPYYYTGNKKITKVIIPEGVESIGKYAFYDCTNLMEVVLPTTITEGANSYLTAIGEGAFGNCTELTKINIGKIEEGNCPVTTLGDYAFYNCKKLTNFDFTSIGWIGNYGFYGCAMLTTIDLPNLAVCGAYAFAGCSRLSNITLYPSTKLAVGMFKDCNKIASISLPYTAIPMRMFENCDGLSVVNFTGAIDSLGDYSFNNCDTLRTVNFSKDATLTNVGVSVFVRSKSLTRFNVASGNSALTTAYSGSIILNSDSTEFILIAPAFNMSKYSWATSNVKSIGKATFSGRTDIVNLDLSLSKIERIEAMAFVENIIINAITLPTSLEYIGELAFAGCYNLTSVTIPDGVTVGKGAFFDCAYIYKDINDKYVLGKALLEVNVGKDVKLGEAAFYYSQGLRTVNLPDDKSVTLDVATFGFCVSLQQIDLTQFVEIPEAAFVECYSLVSPDLSQTQKIGNDAFAFAYMWSHCNYTYLNLASVTELGEGAFFGNASLFEVELNDELKVIPAFAFAANFNLSMINLENVEEIGEGAFYYNISEPIQIIPVGGEQMLDIPEFYPGSGLKTLNLTNCKTIGDGAFAYAAWVTTINAPVVEEIGSEAFAGYVTIDLPASIANNYIYVPRYATSLKTVNFGSEARDIKIGDMAFHVNVNLETFDFANVTEIGAGAFYYNQKLQTVDASKLTSMGEAAFGLSNSLTRFNAPNITQIPDGAFDGCNKLSDLTVGELTKIGKYALCFTAIDSITLTDKLVDTDDEVAIGEGAFGGISTLFEFTKQVTSLDGTYTTNTFTISEDYFVDNGMLYRVLPNGGYELISLPGGKTNSEISVLNGTQRIGAYAGAGNNNIKTLKLPLTLKTIGESAFDKCENLSVVVFQSWRMPELEGAFNAYEERLNGITDIEKPNDNIINYLTFRHRSVMYYYFNFPWYPTDANAAPNIVAVCPTNGVSYDNWMVSVMFDSIVEGVATMTEQSVAVAALLNSLPDAMRVQLSDEAAIVAARIAYDSIPDATQRFLLSQGYSRLASAEMRLAQLKDRDDDNEKPTEDYEVLYNEALETIKGLTIAVWAIGAAAAVIAIGFVLYVFVFSKMKGKKD